MARQRHHWGKALLLAGLAFVVTPRPLAADPVPITNGSVSLYWDGTSGMGMSGPGFSMVVLNTLWGGPMVPPLQAGTMADPDWSFPDPRGIPMGYANIDGVSYRNEDHPLGFVTFGGDLHFDTSPFLVTDTDPTSSFASFSTTFTMSGTLSGFGSGGSLLFSLPLEGRGTSFISGLRRIETSEGVFFNPVLAFQSFTFEADQAPVPEPTSILLVSSGLAGLVLRRARQRKSTREQGASA